MDPATEALRSASAPRWRGKAGRLEVWYATLSDPQTRAGLWIHCETVAPTQGLDPYAHGWATWFPPDGPPRTERFGPVPASFRFAQCLNQGNPITIFEIQIDYDHSDIRILGIDRGGFFSIASAQDAKSAPRQVIPMRIVIRYQQYAAVQKMGCGGFR